MRYGREAVQRHGCACRPDRPCLLHGMTREEQIAVIGRAASPPPDLTRKKSDPEQRFFKYIFKRPDGCWVWTGSTNWNGYGQFAVEGKSVSVHRWAYENFVGPIPDGMEIDHLCRAKRCANPKHLEPVTRKENWNRHVSSRTHCKRGHEYTEENTHITRNGARRCRICVNIRARTRRAQGKVG